MTSTSVLPMSKTGVNTPVLPFVPDHTKARPFLRLEGLEKSFGSFRALDGVSLDIMTGDFVCFLGPSGCGKTTLLRAIAGLDRQSRGLIEMEGRDVSNLPPSDRDFGIVFQSYALFPNLTVSENIAYGLVSRRQGSVEIRDRVAKLLTLVGLSDQASKYPAQLSGGQQQRVALARALAAGPKLLLLDEPLSALDARVRVRLRDELKALQARLGVTTVMVTHDQEEAFALADQIVVMNRGKIEQVGSPAEIYRNPTTAFVADFVGATTTFPATVRDAESLEAFGGLVLQCKACRSFKTGSLVRALIRPEQIEVIEPASMNVANVVQAMIISSSFRGAFSRLKLEAGSDRTELVVDVPAGTAATDAKAAGSTLNLRLPSEAVRLYQPEPV